MVIFIFISKVKCRISKSSSNQESILLGLYVTKKLHLNCSTGKILVSKEEDSLGRTLISLKGCIVQKNDTKKQLIPEY